MGIIPIIFCLVFAINGAKCDICVDDYLLAKNIEYCKIGDKYFDLCNGEQGNCACHEGFKKPKDCQYCIQGYFDFFSDGQCQGKIPLQDYL